MRTSSTGRKRLLIHLPVAIHRNIGGDAVFFINIYWPCLLFKLLFQAASSVFFVSLGITGGFLFQCFGKLIALVGPKMKFVQPAQFVSP
jgi:hypothetical protein